MGLIKDNVNEKLNEIVKKCFEGNRILDRAINQLDTKFILNKTAKALHAPIAHKYPILADFVSEYQGDRNNPTIYGETPRDATEYNNPLRIFEKYVGYQMELEKVISDAMDLAVDEGDYYTQSFLQKFMLDIIPYTKQASLLYDKAKVYEDQWMLFDHNIEDFIIL